MTIKTDLHCHTQESDGSLDCSALLERASKQGVGILSITDHDTTAVYPEAMEIAKQYSIKLIPGVEISTVTDNHQEIHIVGLGVNIDNEPLQELLASNRKARRLRSEKILLKLQKAGFPNLEQQLSQLVKGDVICRSHLAKRKRAWVPIQWQGMATVIETIKAAGGYAILAHPSKYKLSETRLGLVIDAFVAAGGNTIEIAYPGLSPTNRAMLVRQVEKHQLSVSQGSDFHRPGTSWTELRQMTSPFTN